MTLSKNQSLANHWAAQEKVKYETSRAFTQNVINLTEFESELYNYFLNILEQLDGKGSQIERLAFLNKEHHKQVMIRDNDQGRDYYISNAHIHFLDDLITREESGE